MGATAAVEKDEIDSLPSLGMSRRTRHPGNKDDKQKLADANQRRAVIKIVV
jgi:hypothetical protein